MTRFASIVVSLVLVVGGCSDDSAKQGDQQPQEGAAPSVKTDSRQRIGVTNVQELINAIGNDRVIELAPGQYNLAETKDRYMEHVRWKKAYDGPEIILRNVRNMKIIGLGDSPVSVTTPYVYAYVLTLQNTTGVVLTNLSLGHKPDLGGCEGGVVSILNSTDTLIDGCDLYGCGTIGINTQGARDVLVKDSTIRDCTYGILTLRGSRNIKFMSTRMVNNKFYTAIMIDDCKDVAFENCHIAGNRFVGFGDEEKPLFTVVSSSNVIVTGGKIVNNTISRLVAREETVTFVDVAASNNGAKGQ